MRSRYEVILNDQSLAEINPKILILDIAPIQPAIRRYSSQIANRNGLYTGNNFTFGGAGVTISFQIREYSITKRQETYQQIVAWALNGGVLQTNDRPNQRLICKCDTLPSLKSVMKWLDTLTMTFTGYEHPLWEDLHPITLTLAGNNGKGEIFVPGNGEENFVEVKVTPTSTMQNISLTVGDRTIKLQGCNATRYDPITITYDANAIQAIKRGDESILDKRTRDSADDLISLCGKPNQMSFSSSSNVSVSFYARGVWL